MVSREAYLLKLNPWSNEVSPCSGLRWPDGRVTSDRMTAIVACVSREVMRVSAIPAKSGLKAARSSLTIQAQWPNSALFSRTRAKAGSLRMRSASTDVTFRARYPWIRS
ncbi:hypothetical protein [Dawidia soli]|uniref:Uncharacterized protein n=1 Tax=Dawidia soli TaxID=2782352 RepID=A0AAP2GH82_9BACT|nr:hypothetical protein [Dawidia soli]MBT1685748.1 hypothetical protein [Dawidia soli]